MKRFIRIVLLVGVGVVLLSALSFKVNEAKATSANAEILHKPVGSGSCGNWNVVPSLNGSQSSGLTGVAAISANNVWAVGNSGSQRSGQTTLIEHWNGTSWQLVTNPNPGTIDNTLYGVAAISASDAWAVGFYVSTTGVTQTLTEHWNGTSWSVVTSPSPATSNNELLGVAADSANDVWAVGFITNNTSPDQTLIEHWNGKQWSEVPSPNPGSSSDHLIGVTAISANNAWAVGNASNYTQALIEHWNGKQWSVVKSPGASSGSSLEGIAAVSANNIWAVGYLTTNGTLQTLIEHWNGASWQIVKSQNMGAHPALWSVTAISANDVWAVGDDGGSTTFAQTLTEHWNGSSWSVVTSPSPGTSFTQLVSVSAISTNNVWAVGSSDGTTLTEHYHC